MSLSSFLLGKHHSNSNGNKDIDEDLDALLRPSVRLLLSHPLRCSTSLPKNVGTKRRRDVSSDAPPVPLKHKKSVNTRERPSLPSPSTTNPVTLHSKKAKKGKGDDANRPGLEEAYERKVRPRKQTATDPSRIGEQANGTSDSEGDASRLTHETVAAKKDRSNNNTSEQRDARTIFLGNVPTDVAKHKSALKDFKRYIISHVPGAKIESMRFRSVAFQRPTPAAPAPRVHSLERTAEWRATKSSDDVPAPRPRPGPGDKKRIAFIKHELHAEADAVTVYVVFAHAAGLAPDEAAKRAVAALDNTQYQGRTLRADSVGRAAGDPKRTVFVGSLDFASREEDLRVFFEGVVSAERGPRSAVAGDPDSDKDEDEDGMGDPNADGARPKTWVTRVRIVRDKDTQLGKGFAYVQFADRECVDEILALEPGKLKFAKRKLRVERCKVLPSSLNSRDPRAPPTPAPPSRNLRPSTKVTPPTVPKGNPDLGAQLAHLPKDERKAAKAVDPERVARRLAKKKARNALPVPQQRKERSRVRKIATEHKGAGAHAPQKKSRLRSARSITRRNTKK
ncbi:hypothetical protein BC826DRAFT_1024865 [Russula brevipes]|nr:hypothetical protein BC826DRAFT_1024865 [Russula brevipes]